MVSNVLILVWLFIYCFYGNLITWKCLQVADFAYHSQFYNYPNDLKIFTLLMIQRSQRPFYITGYKITRCSLENYSRVCFEWNWFQSDNKIWLKCFVFTVFEHCRVILHALQKSVVKLLLKGHFLIHLQTEKWKSENFGESVHSHRWQLAH